MKKTILIFLIGSLFTTTNFAQSDEATQQQLQQMMEQLQKSFNGQSFFLMDTLLLQHLENLPLGGHSFFFMDTLMMQGLGDPSNPNQNWAMPFSPDNLGMDMNQLLEEFQKGMQQMSPEDWEQMGKLFENFGFQFGSPFMPSPEELEKLKEQELTPEDGKKKRKTIRL